MQRISHGWRRWIEQTADQCHTMREKITGESSLYLATNSPTPLLHLRNETHVSNHPRNLEKSMDHCRQDSCTFTVRKIGSAPSRGKQEIAWRLGAYLVAVAFTQGFKWHSLDRRFCHTIQPRKIFMGKNIFFAHRGTMQLFPRRNSNLSGNLSLETFFMKRNFLSAMFRPHLYFSCRQIRYGEVCCFSFFFCTVIVKRNLRSLEKHFSFLFVSSKKISRIPLQNYRSCTIRSGINYYWYCNQRFNLIIIMWRVLKQILFMWRNWKMLDMASV